MTNEQISSKIAAHKTMIGEYVLRMDNMLDDSDPVNSAMISLIEKAEAEIDRLERTLSVRETVKNFRN